jgi:hypothetical protein
LSNSAKAKAAFFSGVSLFALVATAPRVRASDLPVKALKAPAKPPVEEGKWTWWVEGARFGTLGQSVNFGDPSPVGLPRSGFEGAIGFDYKFAYSPWHVSAQVRYGQTRTQNGVFNRRGNALVPVTPGHTVTVPTTPTIITDPKNVPFNAAGTFTHKESHGLVDFAVGREVGLGSSQAQLKFGVRYAEINAVTNGSGNFQLPAAITTGGAPTGALVNNPFSFQQHSRFTGAGPRLGIEGSIPIYQSWSIDYLGGAAALISERSLTVTTTGAASQVGIYDLLSNSSGIVLNLDVQAMLSYQFTANFKLSGGYRFDGYWNALRTIDANGNIVDGNRFFQGPTVRGTLTF